MARTVVFLALLVVLLLLFVQARRAAMNRPRGRRVTNAPAGADGIVRANPQELARQAGVPLAIYALARMIRSEHGNSPDEVKRWIAWACRNYARKAGVTVDRLLLRGKGQSEGRFAAQYTGKYASTRLDPYESDIAIAREVYSGGADPTGGAIQYDSPAAFAAQPGVRKTAAQVAAARRAAGLELALVPGVPESHVRFWRPVFS